jgi:hypothetical protein
MSSKVSDTGMFQEPKRHPTPWEAAALHAKTQGVGGMPAETSKLVESAMSQEEDALTKEAGHTKRVYKWMLRGVEFLVSCYAVLLLGLAIDQLNADAFNWFYARTTWLTLLLIAVIATLALFLISVVMAVCRRRQLKAMCAAATSALERPLSAPVVASIEHCCPSLYPCSMQHPIIYLQVAAAYMFGWWLVYNLASNSQAPTVTKIVYNNQLRNAVTATLAGSIMMLRDILVWTWCVMSRCRMRKADDSMRKATAEMNSTATSL